MKLLFIGLYVLNLIDAISTALLVRWGFASEVNPLLAIFVSYNPILFFAIKMSIITFCLLVLWLLKNHGWVKPAAIIITSVYSALFAWHVYLWVLAVSHLNTAQCIDSEYELGSKG
jgi:hypothetical protein